MRITLETREPLPPYKCWYLVKPELENCSLGALCKEITKDLQLDAKPKHLRLEMQGFALLPHLPIAGLLHENDHCVYVKKEYRVESCCSH